jgi:hypothetical protein
MQLSNQVASHLHDCALTVIQEFTETCLFHGKQSPLAVSAIMVMRSGGYQLHVQPRLSCCISGAGCLQPSAKEEAAGTCSSLQHISSSGTALLDKKSYCRGDLHYTANYQVQQRSARKSNHPNYMLPQHA